MSVIPFPEGRLGARENCRKTHRMNVALNLLNLPKLVTLGYIDEVSIGHAIISESLTKGFKNTINQYINVTNG